jgi:hypothetical protein
MPLFGKSVLVESYDLFRSAPVVVLQPGASITDHFYFVCEITDRTACRFAAQLLAQCHQDSTGDGLARGFREVSRKLVRIRVLILRGMTRLAF